MAREVINALFAGSSEELLPRYAEGIRRFVDAGGRPPEQLVVVHSPQGLHVTLVWGEGVSHELLGTHMRGLLAELDLPMPSVVHGTLAAASWDDLAAAAV